MAAADEARNRRNGFFLAAFSASGALEGIEWFEQDRFSAHWVKVCRDLLSDRGETFDYQWHSQLSHVRTKLTSVAGAGICTFFAQDQTACSVLLLCGDNKAVEEEVSAMQIDALRNTGFPQLEPSDGFGKIASLTQRPLAVVTPFRDPERATQDDEVIRELVWHFAAAFLCNEAGAQSH